MQNDTATEQEFRQRVQRHRTPGGIKKEIGNNIKHWIGKVLIDGAEGKVKIYDDEEEIKSSIKQRLSWSDRKMSGMVRNSSQPTIFEALILAQEFFKCKVEEIVYLNK